MTSNLIHSLFTCQITHKVIHSHRILFHVPSSPSRNTLTLSVLTLPPSHPHPHSFLNPQTQLPPKKQQRLTHTLSLSPIDGSKRAPKRRPRSTSTIPTGHSSSSSRRLKPIRLPTEVKEAARSMIMKPKTKKKKKIIINTPASQDTPKSISRAAKAPKLHPNPTYLPVYLSRYLCR